MEPWHTKASEYFVTQYPIPSNARQECVATVPTICLFSDLHSSLLCLDRARFVGAQISQNIGPALARFARPAPPVLSETNESVKETVLLKIFKVQSPNFKSLWKKIGTAQATPTAQLPTAITGNVKL